MVKELIREHTVATVSPSLSFTRGETILIHQNQSARMQTKDSEKDKERNVAKSCARWLARAQKAPTQLQEKKGRVGSQPYRPS